MVIVIIIIISETKELLPRFKIVYFYGTTQNPELNSVFNLSATEVEENPQILMNHWEKKNGQMFLFGNNLGFTSLVAVSYTHLTLPTKA